MVPYPRGLDKGLMQLYPRTLDARMITVLFL
jgi:hypothetical protein